MSSSEEKKAAAGAGKPKTYRERLDEYFRGLEIQGLGVPQSSKNRGYPSNVFIAQETGIPVTSVEEHKEIIHKWVAKIGLGEPVEPATPHTEKTQQRQALYERIIGLYLDGLRRNGKSVPEDPANPGKPDLEKISDESGVPLFDLRRASPARTRLLRSVAELGLQVYADFRRGMMTYGELLEEGGEIRRSELEGKRWADQQLYNTKSALRRLMKKKGRSEDDPLGPEFLENFEKTVREITAGIKKVTTRRKFSGEIRRWPTLHRQVLLARGFPRKFHIALREAIKWSGLSLERVAERVGCASEIIRRWINQEREPSKGSSPLISLIEEVLDLPPKTLTSLIPRRCTRRLKGEDYPEFAAIDGEQVKLRDKPDLLSKLRPLLPDDFADRPMEERQEIVDWLCANLIGPTSTWGYLSRLFGKLPYVMNKFPADLEAEIESLEEFKTADLPPEGQQRNGTWSDDTVIARRAALGSIFGALALPKKAKDPRVRGLGLDRTSFCMAMLARGKIMHWWVHWKGARRKDPKGDKNKGKYSYHDAQVVTFIMSLFTKETGWLRQNPQLAERLRPIPGFVDEAFIKKARNDWSTVCDQAYEYYKTLCAQVEDLAQEIRDPFAPIRPILESDNPIAALKLFARNILEDMPDLAVAPVKAARAMRNYMIVRIISATALRRKNLCELTYRDDNKGELRREGDKWVVEIPYLQFKNKDSSFFGPKKKKHNYRRVLKDVDGLYQRLEEYVTLHRPILLGGKQSDVFFVTGSKRPEFSRLRFERVYRSLTILYLAENKYLGRGIPGVKPHGPHAVRDIIATFLIKKTGLFEAVAYALADSVAVVRNHYTCFLPQDKTHLADKLLYEAWASG